MFRLENKVALVTGAGSGIGEAIARAFAAQGAQVIVADVRGDAAESVSAAIREDVGSAYAQTLDVGDEEQVTSTVQALAAGAPSAPARPAAVVDGAGVVRVYANRAGGTGW